MWACVVFVHMLHMLYSIDCIYFFPVELDSLCVLPLNI